MKVGGIAQRSIRVSDDGGAVEVVDQTRLPFAFELRRLEEPADAVEAILSMRVRGAPLIGVTAAYGLCLQARKDPSDAALAAAAKALAATRPTGVNLRWALEAMREALAELPPAERAAAAWAHAARLADADVATNRAIAGHGLALLDEVHGRTGRPVNVLTHCNAGWLATVDWGTALAPVYLAHERGLPVHVWVDETRPRNQGASLTAWELAEHGVAHTVIADNAGGHLMQRGQVDLCLVGTDRTTACGDVCNKIGTYLKALAARDNGVPFYAAVPFSSIDWGIRDAASAIPIEERAAEEVAVVAGRGEDGRPATVRILPERSPVANPAFDVTPARLVTGLLTERGICEASPAGLARLFPETSAAQG
jgi:methylthioribose-1-phosphate isomerase